MATRGSKTTYVHDHVQYVGAQAEFEFGWYSAFADNKVLGDWKVHIYPKMNVEITQSVQTTWLIQSLTQEKIRDCATVKHVLEGLSNPWTKETNKVMSKYLGKLSTRDRGYIFEICDRGVDVRVCREQRWYDFRG